uniref:Uncharacterized protein n=1 Tax=Romanomermis culicivorax TaxID=13658 RepID=A0A915JRF6_ROMCU
KFNLDKQYKPALAEQDGVLRQDYQLNWQTISDHLKHKQHLQVISNLETLTKESLPQQFATTQVENEQEDNKYYAVTMQMMRTVYAEMKIQNLCKDFILII